VDEARHTRRLAALRPGRAEVVTSDEIHSHVLLLATVPEAVRRSFRERLLAPLYGYDTEHHSDLVHTLETFLDCSGSWNRCAAELHVHVNTLRYRIRRIEELTGRDLGTLENRVDLFLALRAT
jgi:DNA-binding PucR family transcriptional regulator